MPEEKMEKRKQNPTRRSLAGQKMINEMMKAIEMKKGGLKKSNERERNMVRRRIKANDDAEVCGILQAGVHDANQMSLLPVVKKRIKKQINDLNRQFKDLEALEEEYRHLNDKKDNKNE